MLKKINITLLVSFEEKNVFRARRPSWDKVEFHPKRNKAQRLGHVNLTIGQVKFWNH